MYFLTPKYYSVRISKLWALKAQPTTECKRRHSFAVFLTAIVLFATVLAASPQPALAQDVSGAEQGIRSQVLLPFVASNSDLDALEIDAAAARGFYVKNGNLLDANGKNFVMRGINYPYAWYHLPQDVGQDFKNIKKTKANTIRVVVSSGKATDNNETWSKTSMRQVKEIVQHCKTNKLVCMLELHDTTGWKERGQTNKRSTLAQAVRYWKSVKKALIGQEKYVIINIGNEPVGNINNEKTNPPEKGPWVRQTKKAIRAMRKAGFKHTLVVDAPNWGQDWKNIMKNNAKQIFQADPQKNVVFSVHMYEVYQESNTIKSYMKSFKDRKLPLIVGEFANKHGNKGTEFVDANAIMRLAQEYKIGYIGWSWSGNTQDKVWQLGYLDITKNFNPNQLTSWGKLLINGANGIKKTSKQASVYR